MINPSPTDPHSLIATTDEGTELHLVREALRLTGGSQKRLAYLMGATGASVCKWLSGRQRVTPMAARAAIGACLLAGVPIIVHKPSRHL